MRKGLLLVLLFAGALAHAQVQVQGDDTGRAVMQLLGPDSAAEKQDIRLLSVTRADSSSLLSDIYARIAQRYSNHGANALAAKYMLATLKQAEAAGNQSKLAWSYNELGAFYKRQREFGRAMQYFNQAKNIFTKLGDKHGLGSVYNGIGDVYENQGNYAEALKYYFAALNTLRETGKKETLTWPYFNIGEVYSLQGRYDSSLVYYSNALQIQHEVGDRSGEEWTYDNIAGVYLKQEKYAEAEQYALHSLAIADSLSEGGGQARAHYSLYEVYQATGRYKDALAHYKAFTKLQETLHNDEQTRNIVKHQMQYDYDRKEEVARMAQKEHEGRVKIVAILLVLTVVVLSLAVYLLRRGSKLKTELLRQREESLHQKEIMMKEIHHRVKNNLQVTSVLLDLQLAGIKDEQSKAAIRESITRLNAISLIHHQLYRNDENNEIEFSQFATSLHEQLHHLFANDGQKVTLTNTIPPTILDIDTAVPLGLILNELITNSYKHAFGAGNNSIKVEIVQRGGRYVLTYTDSGAGLGYAAHQNDTLGMTIIQSLARQIGGAFEYNAANNLFIVSFKDAAEMKKTA